MDFMLIHQDRRSFDSLGVDTVDWPNKVPQSLEKITLVWVDSTLIFNSAKPEFYRGILTLVNLL